MARLSWSTAMSGSPGLAEELAVVPAGAVEVPTKRPGLHPVLTPVGFQDRPTDRLSTHVKRQSSDWRLLDLLSTAQYLLFVWGR